MKNVLWVIALTGFSTVGFAEDKPKASKAWATRADAASAAIAKNCGCRIAFTLLDADFPKGVDIENSTTLFRSMEKKTAVSCREETFKKKFCAAVNAVDVAYAADGNLKYQFTGKKVLMKADNKQHTSSVADILAEVDAKK